MSISAFPHTSAATRDTVNLRHRVARLPERRAPLAKSLTLAAMSLGYVVVQLDVTIVNVAINSIGATYGGSLADLQWIVNAYTITFAAFILTAGALGDRLGAKRVFVLGFAIFVLASLACALAPALWVLIVARLCQGIGAAVLVPNSLALLNHAYPDEAERHWAVGIWAAGASFSLTAGPLVGGGLIALVGWRSIFLINLPVGLAGMWLAWRYASETTRSSTRTLDIPGQIVAVLALGCLAAAMIEGGQRGWLDPWVVAGFAASVGLAALFLTIELRSKGPTLPLSLFRNPAFTATSLTGLLVNVVDRNGVRPDDGCRCRDQSRRRARDGSYQRAAYHRHRRSSHGGKLHRSFGDAAGVQLCVALQPADRDGRRPRSSGPAADINAVGKRRQEIFRHRFGRSQRHAPDRQRPGRCTLRLAAWRIGGIYRRRGDSALDLRRLGTLCFGRRDDRRSPSSGVAPRALVLHRHDRLRHKRGLA